MIDTVKFNTQQRNIHCIQAEYNVTITPCTDIELLDELETDYSIVSTETRLDSLLLGRTYQWVVMISAISTIIELLVAEEKHFNSFAKVFLVFFLATVYSIHLGVLLILRVRHTSQIRTYPSPSRNGAVLP